MSFIRRLFGRSERDEAVPAFPELEPEPEPASLIAPKPTTPAMACPYCAVKLDPPPARSRRCPSCREPIVVRRLDGRTILLAESAVPIFDRQRQRVANLEAWTAGRRRWLALAEGVRAPAARVARVAHADLDETTVDTARSLYVSSADKRVRIARASKRWTEVARIRRQQAAVLFADSGSAVPPPDDIAALHREGMLAELHALAKAYKDVELVGAGCCPTCRAGDGKVFRIAAELREPRLPHPDCPKGLCACEWWVAVPGPKRRQRRKASPAPVATEAAGVTETPELVGAPQVLETLKAPETPDHGAATEPEPVEPLPGPPPRKPARVRARAGDKPAASDPAPARPRARARRATPK